MLHKLLAVLLSCTFYGHHALWRPPAITLQRTTVRVGTPLFEYLNNPEITAFAENFAEDFPVSVSVVYESITGGIPYTVTNPEVIRAVFDALAGITVLAEVGAAHTDDYLNYYFTMADGRIIRGFEFQQGRLVDRWAVHAISGFDALTRVLTAK